MNQSRFIVLTVSAILMMLLSSVAFAEIRIGIGYAADRSTVDVFTEKFPRLKYPRKAQRLQVEGYAVIGFDVKADGSKTDLRVLEAEPRRIFDKSALQFVESLELNPPLKDGEPVDLSDVQFKVNFKLT